MLKNIRLGPKMIGGFLVTALIVLAIGLLGMKEINTLAGQIHEIGEVRLPSVENMLTMEAEMNGLNTVLATLLSPSLTSEDRSERHAEIEKIRERYKEAWNSYESLPQSPEAAELWSRFVPMVKDAAEINNKVAGLSKQLQANDILHPEELLVNLQLFRGDHYKLGTSVGEMLVAHKHFEGGEDPAACNFGKWMAGYSTSNPRMRDLLAQVKPPHDRFHAAVAGIKNAAAAGDAERAARLYREEMIPSAEKVFEYFRGMRAEAQVSRDIFNGMGDLALVQSKAKMAGLLEMEGRLAQMNSDAAAVALKEADAAASQGNTIAIAGMVAGVVIAILLGVLLTRAITGPVGKGVAFAKAMAEGDFSTNLDIEQKDEIGALAEALNSMVDKLRDVVADVQNATDNVASGSEELSATAQSLSQGATEQAASVEEVSSSMEQMASNIKQNADNAQQTQQIAVKAAKDAQEGGEGRVPDRGGHEADRGEDIHHRGDRPADQPAGPERGHRGGPGRRARQGVRRGGGRGAQAGRAERHGGLGDQRVVLLQRGGLGEGRPDALQDGPGHPEDSGPHPGDRRGQQRAERGSRPDQQGHPATGPGHPAERLGFGGDGLDFGGTYRPGRTAFVHHEFLSGRRRLGRRAKGRNVQGVATGPQGPARGQDGQG